MQPDKMSTLEIMYTAGLLAGWVDAGGSIEGWVTFHKLSTNDVILLRQQATALRVSLMDDLEVS